MKLDSFLWVCGFCIFVTFTINLSILSGRCSPCFSRNPINAVERFTYIWIASPVIEALSAASNTHRSRLSYFPMFSQIEEVKAPCQGSTLPVMLFMVTSELFSFYCALLYSSLFFLPGSPVSKLPPGATFTASPRLFYKQDQIWLFRPSGVSLFVYIMLLWLKSAQLNTLCTAHCKQWSSLPACCPFLWLHSRLIRSTGLGLLLEDSGLRDVHDTKLGFHSSTSKHTLNITFQQPGHRMIYFSTWHISEWWLESDFWKFSYKMPWEAVPIPLKSLHIYIYAKR